MLIAKSLVLGLLVVLGLSAAPTAGTVDDRERDQQFIQDFSGKELFATYCASCHGSSAKGDGPIAASFRKRPPDLTQFTKQNKGTFPGELVGKIIDGRQPVKGHGGTNMPVWGDAFLRAREDNDPESVTRKIKAIVDYLETVQERSAQNP